MEEGTGHDVVVVLPGVDDDVLHVPAAGERPLNRRQLDEIGPGTDHGEDAGSVHTELRP